MAKHVVDIWILAIAGKACKVKKKKSAWFVHRLIVGSPGNSAGKTLPRSNLLIKAGYSELY